MKFFQKGDHVNYEGEEWVITGPAYDGGNDPSWTTVVYDITPANQRRGSMTHSVTRHKILHGELSKWVEPEQSKFKIGDKVRVHGTVSKVRDSGVYIKTEVVTIRMPADTVELVERPKPARVYVPGKKYLDCGLTYMYCSEGRTPNILVFYHAPSHRIFDFSRLHAESFTEVTNG